MPQEKNQRQRQTGVRLAQRLLGTRCTAEGEPESAHPPKQLEVSEGLRTSPAKAEVVKIKGSGGKKASLGSWDKPE